MVEKGWILKNNDNKINWTKERKKKERNGKRKTKKEKNRRKEKQQIKTELQNT